MQSGAIRFTREHVFLTWALFTSSDFDVVRGFRTPIFQTTSYVFEDCEQAASRFDLSNFGNIYSRLSNPTTAVLEERVATLEGGRGATCTSSGHAAQLLTLFTLMQPGDMLVASNKLYGGSITQFAKTIRKFGWRCEFVDADDIAAVEAAVAYNGFDIFPLLVAPRSFPQSPCHSLGFHCVARWCALICTRWMVLCCNQKQ